MAPKKEQGAFEVNQAIFDANFLGIGKEYNNSCFGLINQFWYNAKMVQQ